MICEADVLIVTVTEVESRAVMQVFRESTGNDPKPEPIGDRVYLDLGEVNGARVFMALSGMGTGGVGGSQEGVRKGIEALSPSAVIMLGIAFGINERKQTIGDVLVSEQLMLYDLQRVGTDKGGNLQLIPRGDRPHASPWLVNLLKVAHLSWDESRARVRFGLILSGDKLVDNVDFRGQLLRFEPEAIGGEMEGAGLYVASQNSKVDWILVKAICDWADGQKGEDKDARQHLAARNAAAFMLHALQQVPLGCEREPSPRTVRLTSTTLASESRKPLHSSLPCQPYFFGRERELSLVAEAISPEARTWGALIDGPGGIGKTALAIRAAHLAPAAHFDRQVFLSAKLTELTSVGTQELGDFALPNYMALLTELGHELGEHDIERTDPNQRAKAVRRALAGVRALIVIDNVETFLEADRMRLYQFLSRLPVTCKAIVTSRRRADIDARVIRLDRLKRRAGLDLIAELAKSNRHLQEATEQERSDLYETTNGNPLLIKWTVGQLGRRDSHCRTIPEACVFLESASEGNDPLEFIFGDLLDTFTDSETAVLAALAHFTQPAKLEWIADVAGIAEPAALTALQDLTDRALLVSDEEAQIFLLPPLAATFIRRTRPEVIAQTGARLTDRVLAFALENGGQNYDRFPALEAEWPAIAAALPLFVQGENRRLQMIVRALGDFMYFSGRWDEELTLRQQAEEKAVAAAEFRNAGWLAYYQAFAYYKRRQVAELEACAVRCSRHWEKVSLSGGEYKADVFRLRGLCHQLEENYPAAIEAFRESLALTQAVAPQSDNVHLLLNDLAEVKHLQGDYEGAERDYREASRVAKRVQKTGRSIPVYLGNLAELALKRGDWAVAESNAREALEQAEKLGWQELIGCDCWRLATALARQGKPLEGLPYARRAVAILSGLRMPTDLEKAQAALKECGGEASSAERVPPQLR